MPEQLSQSSKTVATAHALSLANAANLPNKQVIVELAAATLGCAAAALSTLDDTGHTVLASAGSSALIAAIPMRQVADVINTAKTRVMRTPAPKEQFQISLPLFGSNKNVLGVLSLVDDRERHFSLEEKRTLKSLQTMGNTLLTMHDAHRVLAERQTELQVTLENMDQGVTVFDADANLTLWNQRYLDIFSIDPAVVYKGAPLRNLIASKELQNGFVGFSDEYETMLSELRAGLARGEMVLGGVELNDGRIISSSHVAIPNGGWVATHSDITQRVKSEEKIKHASLHDTMTGLANRDKFTNEFEARQKADGHMALMLVDIDHFKAVNDNFGHGAGDAVIKSVAERLQSCVRSSDVVARLGGDEFAVLLHLPKDAQTADMHRIARSVVDRMRQDVFFEGTVINFSVSVGCHEMSAGNTKLEDALSRADFALYKAKEKGRSRYQLFDHHIADELFHSKRMQALVREDTYAQKLKMNYQPIVCLHHHHDYGFEALIRWAGGQSEYMNPCDIIQAAERNGAITSLGEWILNQSLAESKDWPSHLRIAVNVSPKQLGLGGFAQQVQQALDHWAIAPHRLELEVTETALLQDQASIDELHKIKALGVRIALDDFGTGYSSLTLLQRFPFDKLKIDRSFVDGVDTDPLSLAIVRSVVQLGHEAKIKTVAEGIESRQHLDVMETIGCSLGQGYLLGKPMGADMVGHRITTLSKVA